MSRNSIHRKQGTEKFSGRCYRSSEGNAISAGGRERPPQGHSTDPEVKESAGHSHDLHGDRGSSPEELGATGKGKQPQLERKDAGRP